MTRTRSGYFAQNCDFASLGRLFSATKKVLYIHCGSRREDLFRPIVRSVRFNSVDTSVPPMTRADRGGS